ncbi:translation initiation factor IF-2-like [Nycticebus coucang]|uniref:translation initiation factor IF-2-like n=1 Tax=Nycticebus coucang TaxID=9470 RepID=UPI00234DD27B|nr:translation initiation factor IF-2-like [Nycticebus coucang]
MVASESLPGVFSTSSASHQGTCKPRSRKPLTEPGRLSSSGERPPTWCLLQVRVGHSAPPTSFPSCSRRAAASRRLSTLGSFEQRRRQQQPGRSHAPRWRRSVLPGSSHCTAQGTASALRPPCARAGRPARGAGAEGRGRGRLAGPASAPRAREAAGPGFPRARVGRGAGRPVPAARLPLAGTSSATARGGARGAGRGQRGGGDRRRSQSERRPPPPAAPSGCPGDPGNRQAHGIRDGGPHPRPGLASPSEDASIHSPAGCVRRSSPKRGSGGVGEDNEKP